MDRSETYRFTVESLTDPRLVALRERVKHVNATNKHYGLEEEIPRFRVSVFGRLGKNSPQKALYAGRGRFGPFRIKNAHASRFDVYVHEVCSRGF
jgi:hypothetical protein